MLDLARLNERAGIKAVDSCDYVTAQAYLKTALSLLPKDHWKTCYHQSHRMYFSLAKAAYACGAMDKAQEVLQEILRECTCTEDKLQAYYLLVTSKCHNCYLILHLGKGFLQMTVFCFPVHIFSQSSLPVVKGSTRTLLATMF